MTITPKNWAEFQHYKDRAPPWIKLHKGLLDNFEYQSLPVASRALAPMLWLLASDHERGEIDAAPKKLAFRLRMTEREVADALKPLIDNEFFVISGDASGMLAGGKRDACLEERQRERQIREREEAEAKARDFETFWRAYPKKDGKKDALSAWAKVEAPLDVILSAIEKRRTTNDWMKSNGQFVPLPATWLRGKRWEDELTSFGSSTPANTHKYAAAAKTIFGDHTNDARTIDV